MFKIVKENDRFGDLRRGDANKLYYKGELRGYAYKDGSWFTIANFTSSRYGETYTVYIYDSDNDLYDEYERKGRMWEAEEWVEEVISKNYDNALELSDDKYDDEDDYYYDEDDDYYYDDYYDED